MATNFGFMPVLTGQRYFISYKNEDAGRISKITRRLNEMGVPMWYDYGIEKGERWSREINRNIDECEAVLIFATKTLFAVEDTYVRKEFRLARIYDKKIFVVWLDDVKPRDVNKAIMDWFLDVEDLQGIQVEGQSVDKIAWSMATEFHLRKGLNPQPLSPVYQPPSQSVSKPQAAPKSLLQPVKKTQLTPRTNVRVGDRLTFGQYPQGEKGEVQPLVWRVLDVTDSSALLITEKLIDALPYNTEQTKVTWETCTLRQWLHHDFIRKAFSREEQAKMETYFIVEDSSKTIQDDIFVLSVDEAEKYFRNDGDRMAEVTEYAKARGAFILDNNATKRYKPTHSLPTGGNLGWWWLRSCGTPDYCAPRVDCDGLINRSGNLVNHGEVSVRPAFWVDLTQG